MLAFWTLVKDCLAFIDGPQLHCVVTNFLGAAFDASFFNGGSHGLTRPQQQGLFGVRFGPNRRRSGHGVGSGRRQFGHFAEIGLVRTNVAINSARFIDFKGGPAARTKGPGHGCAWLMFPAVATLVFV